MPRHDSAAAARASACADEGTLPSVPSGGASGRQDLSNPPQSPAAFRRPSSQAKPTFSLFHVPGWLGPGPPHPPPPADGLGSPSPHMVAEALRSPLSAFPLSPLPPPLSPHSQQQAKQPRAHGVPALVPDAWGTARVRVPLLLLLLALLGAWIVYQLSSSPWLALNAAASAADGCSSGKDSSSGSSGCGSLMKSSGKDHATTGRSTSIRSRARIGRRRRRGWTAGRRVVDEETDRQQEEEENEEEDDPWLLFLGRRNKSECWSRREAKHLFKVFPHVNASAALVQGLARFEATQRRCLAALHGDIPAIAKAMGWSGAEDMEASNSSSNGSSALFFAQAQSMDCRFVVWRTAFYAGTGNSILTLVTAFALALLTDRALVVPANSFAARLFCNPVPTAASWALPSTRFTQVFEPDNAPNVFQTAKEYGHNWTRVDEELPDWETRTIVFDVRKWWPSMFCKGALERVARTPAFIVEGYEYAVPALYLVPSLRTELESLFPDNRPFLHLARYLLNPTNDMWHQITATYLGYLAHHDSIVGLQIRPIEVLNETDLVQRVLQCATDVAKYIPKPLSFAFPVTHMRGRSQQPRSVAVFVASLHQCFFTSLRSAFSAGKTHTSDIVSIYSFSSDERQMFSADQERKAITEMWLLSFSDRLLLSHASTFGYVAAGLSGIEPMSMNIVTWLERGIDYRNNSEPVCESWMSEPCFHLGEPNNIQCPDPEQQSPSTDEPYINHNQQDQQQQHDHDKGYERQQQKQRQLQQKHDIDVLTRQGPPVGAGGSKGINCLGWEQRGLSMPIP